MLPESMICIKKARTINSSVCLSSNLYIIIGSCTLGSIQVRYYRYHCFGKAPALGCYPTLKTIFLLHELALYLQETKSRLDQIQPLGDMWASDADWVFNSQRFWHVLILFFYYHHFPGHTFLFYSGSQASFRLGVGANKGKFEHLLVCCLALGY